MEARQRAYGLWIAIMLMTLGGAGIALALRDRNVYLLSPIYSWVAGSLLLADGVFEGWRALRAGHRFDRHDPACDCAVCD